MLLEGEMHAFERAQYICSRMKVDERGGDNVHPDARAIVEKLRHSS